MSNSKHIEYVIRENFQIECGFQVTSLDIYEAIIHTSNLLYSLPISLYRSIDYKATSGIIGAIFCNNLARLVGALVNPIEKGHPDIIPNGGRHATEQELRNYPFGLEVKTTIGNVKSKTDFSLGNTRIIHLTGITWQAHHREVDSLLGLVWDFTGMDGVENVFYPFITGAFYSESLNHDDWGTISGTTGRNTKVTGMTASGKKKMGEGWVALINDERYLTRYQQILGFNI